MRERHIISSSIEKIPTHLQLTSRILSPQTNWILQIAVALLLSAVSLLIPLDPEWGLAPLLSYSYIGGILLSAITSWVICIGMGVEALKPYYLHIAQPLLGRGDSSSSREGWKIDFPIDRLLEKSRYIHKAARILFEIAWNSNICIVLLFYGVMVPTMQDVFQKFNIYTTILLYLMHSLPIIYTAYYMWCSHILFKITHLWITLLCMGIYGAFNCYMVLAKGIIFYRFLRWNDMLTLITIVSILGITCVAHYAGYRLGLAKYID